MTPPTIPTSPAGQSSVSYRLESRATAAARMAQEVRRALGGKTKDGTALGSDADPTIALLDAWATCADVLSFYQERIINEGFLRTATERRSVVELANLVGYTPRPGVSASTWLAYEVEKGQEAVDIPARTKAQSLPLPGQLPQTYETATPLVAGFGWNRVSPILGHETPFAPADNKPIEVVLKSASVPVRLGRPVLTWTAPDAPCVRPLSAAEPVPSTGQLRLLLGAPYDEKKRLEFRTTWKPQQSIPRHILDWFKDKLHVAAEFISKEARFDERMIRRLIGLHPHRTAEIQTVVRSDHAPAAVDGPTGIHLFQITAGLFGSNSTLFELADPKKRRELNDNDRASFDAKSIALDGVYDIPPQSWLTLFFGDGRYFVGSVRDVRTVTKTRFDMVGRVTEVNVDWLEFAGVREPTLGPYLKDGGIDALRSVLVYAGSQRVEMADTPDPTPIEDSIIETGVIGSGVEPGRSIVVVGTTVAKNGEPGGTVATEARTIARAEIAYGPVRSVLHLNEPLTNAYVRGSVAIYGNVVQATHGETVNQTLGGGTGRAFESFTLRQKPLVFLRGTAADGTGAVAALEVRVNGVRWHLAVNGLTDAEPGDRVYEIDEDDDGFARVHFGDGVRGARLPTGIDNVTATYRIGEGRLGDADAGRVTLPIDRPTGVKTVTNPIPATGGAGRETGEMLRRNVARSTTLFDRLVSADDYEHFAAAFAGVGKAKSIGPGTGRTAVVGRRLYMTVAGVTDSPLPPHGPTFTDLIDAFRDRGDPRMVVSLAPHRPVPLQLDAAIRVDPDYRFVEVRKAVVAALLRDFGYTARDLGGSIETSAVVACIQRCAGVTGVDLRSLSAARLDTPDSALNARPMTMLDGALVGVELLYFKADLPENVHLTDWTAATGEGAS